MLNRIASRRKPALQTTMFTSPKADTAVSNIPFDAFQSATSPKCGTASPPIDLISSHTARAALSSMPEPSRATPRSFTTTRAPRRASSSAWQRPSPIAPPVTIATFPSSIS